MNGFYCIESVIVCLLWLKMEKQNKADYVLFFHLKRTADFILD